jgi:DNA-binding MurR/RpiR family transcriptional regulator
MQPREALESGLAQMRPSEAEVARHLLRDMARVANHSLREVAAWCGTSDATVVRACRAAGFDGYQDLKYHVLREVLGRQPQDPMAVGRNGAPPEHPGPDYGADIGASLEACEPILAAAVALLHPARRVAIAGVGASLGIGLVLSDVLSALGRQTITLGDAQTLAFVLTPPRNDLVLVAISHSGETRFPLLAVREAKAAGVPTLGLSNEPGSELARTVSLFLPTRTVERPEGSFSIAPRVGQLAVLDRLISHLKPTQEPARAREVRG